MNNRQTQSGKSTFLAVLFFAAMTALGSLTLHAQDTVNPLLSTTGANVLGEGHIQWNSSLQWNHIKNHYSNYTRQFDGIGINTGFRFGIGNRAELTLGVEAFHYNYKTNWEGTGYNSADMADMEGRGLAPDNISVAPSVGARLLLFEGREWLPKVTFNTAVALATVHGRQWAADETLVQPTIGLAFRNDLGKGWMLDYAVDFTWNRHFPIQNFPVASCSIFAHWLATDRLMLGAGFNTATWTKPFMGAFEVRYLATHDLQLTLQGGVSSGESLGVWNGSAQVNALAGISWMIK